MAAPARRRRLPLVEEEKKTAVIPERALRRAPRG